MENDDPDVEVIREKALPKTGEASKGKSKAVKTAEGSSPASAMTAEGETPDSEASEDQVEGEEQEEEEEDESDDDVDK